MWDTKCQNEDPGLVRGLRSGFPHLFSCPSSWCLKTPLLKLIGDGQREHGLGALILPSAYVEEQHGAAAQAAAATRQQPRPIRGTEIMSKVALGLEILLREDEKVSPSPN